ncbi:MAG: hypothetical protein JWR26_3220 [Pedosphaera sp.]|nr:hypothetical protein [Pedosphaera sp.]
MNKKLLFWVIFWPSFLASLLLNTVKSHYHLPDDAFLIIGFGAFVALSGLGLIPAIKRLKE